MTEHLKAEQRDIRHGTNWAYGRYGCRCDACRAEHNRVARDYGTNVRTGARAEQKRRWDRENKPICSCGQPMARQRSRCLRCSREARREARDRRYRVIAAMWNEGASMIEIGVALGIAKGTLSSYLDRMRKEGWDVPHRYRLARSTRS